MQKGGRMAGRTQIVGVDYSGAKANVPWITTAVLDGTILMVQSCEDIDRADLTKRLRKLPNDAVVAMDFPFGVPQQFAHEIDPNATAMPDLWRIAASDDMEYSQFKKLCDCFTQRRNNEEVLRCGDIHFDGPFSPLKTEGLIMSLMTHRGMEMLHHLWQSKAPRFRVKPLPAEGRDGPILLETMPGVWLRKLVLPHEGYKGGKGNKRSRKIRNDILNGLIRKPRLSLLIPNTEYEKSLDYHDCLDSLVAAIAGAYWVCRRDTLLEPHPTQTVKQRHPNGKRRQRISPEAQAMPELMAARLEGWIYAPKG